MADQEETGMQMGTNNLEASDAGVWMLLRG